MPGKEAPISKNLKKSTQALLSIIAIIFLLLTICAIDLLNNGVAMEAVSRNNVQKLATITWVFEIDSKGLTISLTDSDRFRIEKGCLRGHKARENLIKTRSKNPDYDIRWENRLIFTVWSPLSQKEVNSRMIDSFHSLTRQCGSKITTSL